MTKYLLKRLFWMVPLLVGISLVSFLIMHLAPGDITTTEASFNPKASEESRQKLRQIYHLDKPVIVQYGLWLKRMATLDFGTSFATHQRPVFWQVKDEEGNITKGMIQEALPITLLINVLSLVLIIVCALPLGVISALTQNRPPDRAITMFVFVGFAIPGFWLALMMMYWTRGGARLATHFRTAQPDLRKDGWLRKIATLSKPSGNPGIYLRPRRTGRHFAVSCATACWMYCIRTTSPLHAPKACLKIAWCTAMRLRNACCR